MVEKKGEKKRQKKKSRKSGDITIDKHGGFGEASWFPRVRTVEFVRLIRSPLKVT